MEKYRSSLKDRKQTLEVCRSPIYLNVAEKYRSLLSIHCSLALWIREHSAMTGLISDRQTFKA